MSVTAQPGTRQPNTPWSPPGHPAQVVAANVPPPRRGMLRRPLLDLVALALLPATVFALMIGFSDTFQGQGLSSRLVGALFLLAGLCLAGGVVGLLVNTRRGISFALVASLTGVLTGGMLLLAEWSSYDWAWHRLGVWGAIIVACLAASMALLRSGASLPSLRQIGGVVSAGLIGALAQFWYANTYVPTAVPPTLNLAAAMEIVGEQDGIVSVGLTIDAENVGANRVRVVGSLIRVVGYTVDRTAAGDDDTGFERELVGVARDGIGARRYGDALTSQVLQAEEPFVVGYFFEPEETSTRRLVLHVPRDQFDLLGLDVWVSVAKGQTLDFDAATFAFDPAEIEVDGEQALYREWTVQESSLLNRLTRGRRTLINYWFTAGPEPLYPRLEVVVGRQNPVRYWADGDEAFRRGLEALYGLANTSTYTELSLWQPAAPAPDPTPDPTP